jgi:hypothetical protein
MYDINNGNFMRSFYVLVAGSVVNPTGLDFVPGNDVDCNLNLIPDGCDIASGTSQDVNGNGIPDECEPPGIPGDLDGDGFVGVKDLLILLGGWGPCADCDDCIADLDGDCNVGVKDLLILLGNWG